MALLLCCISSLIVCAVAQPSLVFSAGFTSDMVLQRSPSQAAVYGLVSSSSGASINVALVDANGSIVANVSAAVFDGSGAGTACDAQCYASGYTCAVGQSSCCAAPSCPMGCLMSAATTSVISCVEECKAAKTAGCSYTIPNTTATLSMCGDCLPQCPGCPDFEAQCEAGCSFGASPRALSWKAFLPPQVAGGSYTLTVSCSQGFSNSLTLERVTFGDVWFASGQSNMALGMQYSFSRDELVAKVQAGRYSNIRFYQYGGMGDQIDGTEPSWATTVATAPFWSWQNLSNALGQEGYASFDTLSATAMHFAVSLTDLRSVGGEDVPLGIITTAVGGTTVEAWSSREMLAACKNRARGIQRRHLHLSSRAWPRPL